MILVRSWHKECTALHDFSCFLQQPSNGGIVAFIPQQRNWPLLVFTEVSLCPTKMAILKCASLKGNAVLLLKQFCENKDSDTLTLLLRHYRAAVTDNRTWTKQLKKTYTKNIRKSANRTKNCGLGAKSPGMLHEPFMAVSQISPNLSS